MEQKLIKAEKKVLSAGAELTKVRKQAAKELEQRIQQELRELDMKKIRFSIDFQEKAPAADGCDTIRFLMSANAGEDLRPIARIASGGELLEQIDEMDKWEGSQLNRAKEILAYELTKLVHGEEEAEKAQETARGLFAGAGSTENMPCTMLCEGDFTDGKIDILTLLVKCGLAASRGEARRLVQQGGVSVGGEKVGDIERCWCCDECDCKDGLVIKKGKKVFHRAAMER